MNYNEIRFKFRKELNKIAIFFKEEKNFNIINLLLPNVWQNDPKKTDPNYYEIKEKNVRFDSVSNGAVEQLELGSNGVSLQ